MMLLQGGRGDISISWAGVTGGQSVLLFSATAIRGEPGSFNPAPSPRFEDIILGFASPHPGSFRAIAETATELAEKMENDQCGSLGEATTVDHFGDDDDEFEKKVEFDRIVRNLTAGLRDMGCDRIVEEQVADLLIESVYPGDDLPEPETADDEYARPMQHESPAKQVCGLIDELGYNAMLDAITPQGVLQSSIVRGSIEQLQKVLSELENKERTATTPTSSDELFQQFALSEGDE